MDAERELEMSDDELVTDAEADEPEEEGGLRLTLVVPALLEDIEEEEERETEDEEEAVIPVAVVVNDEADGVPSILTSIVLFFLPFNNLGFNTPNENVFALFVFSGFFLYLFPFMSIVTRVGFSVERLINNNFLLAVGGEPDNFNGRDEAFSTVGGVAAAIADPFFPLEETGFEEDKKEDIG